MVIQHLLYYLAGAAVFMGVQRAITLLFSLAAYLVCLHVLFDDHHALLETFGAIHKRLGIEPALEDAPIEMLAKPKKHGREYMDVLSSKGKKRVEMETQNDNQKMEMETQNDNQKMEMEPQIEPRIFQPRALDKFPCILEPPNNNKNKKWWILPEEPDDMPREGFFFLKTHKTGSSSAAGVHLRIARNVAAAQMGTTGSLLDSGNKANITLCRSQFQHAPARRLRYAERIKEKSFLWTVLRDPNERALSDFFHFGVSRRNFEPTGEGLEQYLLDHAKEKQDYYMKMLSMKAPPNSVNPMKTFTLEPPQSAETMRARIQSIIDDYDFIAITERLDESIVALQMLLGLSTADMLFLSAKSNGGYDAGGWGNQCVRIHPRSVTPEMETFLVSTKWESMVQWDRLLYQAANASLDQTIDALKKNHDNDRFEQNLAQFRHAQSVVKAQCTAKVRFPCSADRDGRPPLRKNSCLWSDSACGMKCLDKVSDQLGLWNTPNE